MGTRQRSSSKRQRSSSKRPRRTRAGAATVEAVILIPVLAVLWFGILYEQAHAAARQRARATARRCAWTHAVGGCDETPSDCEGLVHTAERAPTPADAPDDADADKAAESVIAEGLGAGVLDDVPLLGPALDGLLGPATEFTAARSVERAGFAGTARGRFHLLCNAKPQEPRAAVGTMFCDRTKFCEL